MTAERARKRPLRQVRRRRRARLMERGFHGNLGWTQIGASSDGGTDDVRKLTEAGYLATMPAEEDWIMNVDLQQLRGLSVAEKLEIVTALWDDLAASSEGLVIPNQVLSEASRRLHEIKGDSSPAIDDAELWRRVNGQFAPISPARCG